MAQALTTRRLRITPKPGFVVKTATTAPGFYTPNPTSSTSASIEREAVPPARKVFVNVAYDGTIPEPEEDAEYVPVVVSNGRGDVDKAGNPSLVFDAILNPALKSRITKDTTYRAFVLEVILAQIEAPPYAPSTTPPRELVLSRTLGTPNIRSKGVLAPREIEVPALAAPGTAAETEPPKKPLIEEIPAVPKSILKKAPKPENVDEPDPHEKSAADARLKMPMYSWEDDKLVVELPDFTREDHARSTLFLASDIVTLRTPKFFLQLPLDMAVDVEAARAEWRVSATRLVVHMKSK